MNINQKLNYAFKYMQPANPDLYEFAKAIIFSRYKKNSAYRSGAIQKLYKELGGTYIDNNKPSQRPLARWFKEEWQDIGNKKYPVYRPKKRISKETPLTISEISPQNLKEQVKLKQKYKGKKNLPKFIPK